MPMLAPGTPGSGEGLRDANKGGQTDWHGRSCYRRFSVTPAQKDWVSKTELDRFGIVTVPTEMFLWGGYRYTNARDALAAAKRGGSQ